MSSAGCQFEARTRLRAVRPSSLARLRRKRELQPTSRGTSTARGSLCVSQGLGSPREAAHTHTHTGHRPADPTTYSPPAPEFRARVSHFRKRQFGNYQQKASGTSSAILGRDSRERGVDLLPYFTDKGYPAHRKRIWILYMFLASCFGQVSNELFMSVKFRIKYCICAHG